MTVIEHWAGANVQVTVILFCKVCWKIGAHLAAELLEEAAKVESSGLSVHVSWEPTDELAVDSSSQYYELESDIMKFSESINV